MRLELDDKLKIAVPTDESTSYKPNSQWAIIDALEAIKWAYVFAEYGSDSDADKLVDIIKEKVRAHPNDPTLIQKLYDAVTWRFAMDMRIGTTFQDAIKTIKDDINWIADQVRKYRL